MKRKRSRSSTYKVYADRVGHAKQWRDAEGYDALWERMIDLYRGKQVPQGAKGDQMVVNISKSTVDVIAPSVAVNQPKITVSANKPEDGDKAVIVEQLMNYQWRHYDWQPEVRAAVDDMLVCGPGWVKVFWRFGQREVPMTDEQRSSMYEEKVAEADAAAAADPEMADLLPSDDEIEQYLGETTTEVVEDQPVVERVSPFDIFVDPFASSERNMRWIAQRIYRPLADVKADTRYRQGARRKVEAGDVDSDDSRYNTGRDRKSPDQQVVTVWEFYDIDANCLSVFADGLDEFLVDPMPIPFAGGHPFYMLRDYNVPDQFYPMGELEAIEQLQLELNATRTQFHQARQKAARKYLYHESALGATGRAALESRTDNQFVPVADESRPLDSIVIPLPQTQLPPELFTVSEQVEQDIATVSGVSEYQRGQAPSTRQTATEAAIISDSASARSADKLAIVERAIAGIARKVLQANQQFTTGEQVFEVVGREGASVWVPWTREDITGEFDFSVEGGSTQPQNETVRRQTAVAMMQAMQPFMAAGVVDPAKLAEHVLRFGFGMNDAHKFIAPPMPLPPPEPGAEAGGVGGVQPPPMGGGYIDQGSGDTSSEARRLMEQGGAIE